MLSFEAYESCKVLTVSFRKVSMLVHIGQVVRLAMFRGGAAWLGIDDTDNGIDDAFASCWD